MPRGQRRGWHHSEESKLKMRLRKLGKPSPRKGKSYEEIYGVERAEEIRQKLSERKKGKPSPRRGKHHSEATKLRLSLARKGKHYSPRTEFKRGMHASPETEFKKGEQRGHRFERGHVPWNKDKKLPYDVWNKGKHDVMSPEHMEKIKRVLTSPENRRKILKGLLKRPTKPEQKFIELTKKYRLPFRYVGDGELIIGTKCPDFSDGNGSLVEIFGRAYHDPRYSFRKIRWHQTEEGVVKYYKQHGFRCLVIWEDELEDETDVVKRVKSFMD